MPAKLSIFLLAKAVSFKDPWKQGQEVMVMWLRPGFQGGQASLLAINGMLTSRCRSPQPPSL